MCTCRWLWPVRVSEKRWVSERRRTESCKDTHHIAWRTTHTHTVTHAHVHIHRASHSHTRVQPTRYDTLKCIFLFFSLSSFFFWFCTSVGALGPLKPPLEQQKQQLLASHPRFYYTFYFISPYSGQLLTLYAWPCDLLNFSFSLSACFLRFLLLCVFCSHIRNRLLRLFCLLWRPNCPAMYAKVFRFSVCTFTLLLLIWRHFLAKQLLYFLWVTDGRAAYVSGSNLPSS